MILISHFINRRVGRLGRLNYEYINILLHFGRIDWNKYYITECELHIIWDYRFFATTTIWKRWFVRYSDMSHICNIRYVKRIRHSISHSIIALIQSSIYDQLFFRSASKGNNWSNLANDMHNKLINEKNKIKINSNQVKNILKFGTLFIEILATILL